MSTCTNRREVASSSPVMPDGFVRDWRFVASAPRPIDMARRVRGFASRRRAAPVSQVLKPLARADRWSLFFVYLPDGKLTTSHRFTLEMLRRLGRRLLVVVAAPEVASISADLPDLVDALIWKDLPGFDFSAYAIGMRSIADASSGADVLVMNDSVYGPFGDVEAWISAAPWRLAGFTASDDIENHLQSYAFHVRGVDDALLRAWRSIFSPRWCFDDFWEVVRNQETRFARVAARGVSVGAVLFARTAVTGDPMLRSGLALFEAGLPFLKRSLTGKFAADYDQALLVRSLSSRGYPVDDR